MNVHFWSLRGEHCLTHRNRAGLRPWEEGLCTFLPQHNLSELSSDHSPPIGHNPLWASWHFQPCFGQSGNQGVITIPSAILGGPLPSSSKGSGPHHLAGRPLLCSILTVWAVHGYLLHSLAFSPWKALLSARVTHRHILTFAIKTQRGFPEQWFPAWRISQLSPRHPKFSIPIAKPDNLYQMCWQNWSSSNCRVRSKPCQTRGKTRALLTPITIPIDRPQATRRPRSWKQVLCSAFKQFQSQFKDKNVQLILSHFLS